MTVSSTLAERGSRYGEFADHAKIAQGLQDVMRAAHKWQYLDHDMKQALSVIADKIARILNGDPYYQDNWHDIQGYALLIENRLKLLDTPQEDTLFEEPKKPIGQWDGKVPISIGFPGKMPRRITEGPGATA